MMENINVCGVCWKSEEDNPDLEFHIDSDPFNNSEIVVCSDCRERKDRHD